MTIVGTAEVQIVSNDAGFESGMRSGLAPALGGLEAEGVTAGENLGAGVTRGADGRLRDAKGRFVAAGEDLGGGISTGVSKGTQEIEKELEKTGTQGGKAMSKGLSGALGSMTSALGLLGVPIGQTGAKMQQIGSTAESAGKRGSSSLTAFQSVGQKALIGIGIGAAVAGVAAVKMASDFQSSMTSLVTGAGESEKNIGLVSSGILNMAGQTGTSASELAKGMYLVESAGYHGATGLTVLKAAAEGAKVGSADLSTVADAVTSGMNAYGLSSSKAAAFTNQLITTVASGKMHMQDLAGALSAVLPTAAAAHVSFAQVGGAIATMTAQGVTAQQAAQNLAGTIRSLQNPSQTQIAEMEQLGLSANGVATGLGKKGLTGTISELVGAVTSQMGPAGTVLLNSFRQSQSASQDANKMIQAMPASLQALAKQYQSGAMTAAEWRKAMKGLPVDQKEMATQFAATEQKSKGFNDTLKSGSPAAQTFNAALSKLMGGSTGLNTALLLTGSHMATFKANTEAVGKAGEGSGKSIEGFAAVQKDLKFQMEQAKDTVQAMAIRLGDALIPMVEFALKGFSKFAGFLESHKPLLYAFAAVIGTVLVAAIASYVAHLAVAGAESLQEFGKMLAEGVKWAVQTVIKIATVTAAWAVHFAKWLAESIPAFAKFLAEHAVMAATWIAQNTAMVASAVAAFVAENAAMLGIGVAIAALVAGVIWVATHWKQTWDLIKRIALDVWHFLDHIWSTVENSVHSVFSRVMAFLKKWGVDLLVVFLPVVGIPLWLATHWHQVETDAKAIFGDIVKFFATIPDKLLAGLLSLEGKLHDWIWSAIHTVENVVVSGWEAEIAFWKSIPGRVIAAVEGLGGMLWGWIVSAWGLVTSGLSTAWSATYSFVSSLPGKILSALGNLGSLLLSAGGDIVQGLINGISAAWSGVWSFIKGKLGSLMHSVLGFFGIGSPSKVFHGIGINLMEGLANGVGAGTAQVTQAVGLMAKQVTGSMPGTLEVGAALSAGVGSSTTPTTPAASATHVEVHVASGAVQITGHNPESASAASDAVTEGFTTLARQLAGGVAPTRIGAH
ncbi:MAG: phage tail tape measure protein [Rhodospirillales bacterium]|nr:phage tail tape measure protein [Rhodospirillales bacterium]